MRSLPRVLVAVVGVAVAGSLVTSAPAQAVATPTTASAAASVVPCLTGLAGFSGLAAVTEPEVPVYRQNADTSPVTAADVAALPAQPVQPAQPAQPAPPAQDNLRQLAAPEAAPRLANRVSIPTYVHVIKGKHGAERTPTGPQRIRNVIRILNNGMAGTQSKLSARARFRFSLKKIDYTRNDGWFHAYNNGPRDGRMKRALHRGNAGTLNLYINGGGPRGSAVLGWARFPWQYRSAPKRDGVTVTVAALPGGRASGYNRGDTVIHETAHWLGLFHTFQGGCGAKGDSVSDTPAEGQPSYYCETTRDTCAATGLDPVRNFVDYSLDACMNRFTAGQVQRMDASFEKWRS